jgi:hypothetical protein
VLTRLSAEHHAHAQSPVSHDFVVPDSRSADPAL